MAQCAPVFLCVMGVAKNITKHSVIQVRQLLFKQLEKLTLQKQQKPSDPLQQKDEDQHQPLKAVRQVQNIIQEEPGLGEPQPPFLPKQTPD